jgi:hypothetical protein
MLLYNYININMPSLLQDQLDAQSQEIAELKAILLQQHV